MGGAPVRPTIDPGPDGTEGPLPRPADGPSVLPTPTRVRTGNSPGASVTDQETDARSRRFEWGIPDPDHEPSNRIIRPIGPGRTSGRQRSSPLGLHHQTHRPPPGYPGGGPALQGDAQ